MTNLADAAKRRTKGTAKKPEEKAPNLSKIQALIDESANGTFDQTQEPQQMGDYDGPGAEHLHEALAQARAGIDSPEPPPEVLARMQRERILPFLTPDVADMAARYGVIPPGGNGM
jgi:hypothetical protein